ncbi:MAG: hypothetical protein P8L82_02280 [Paracoccaceae bacterium]|nr:hypothetical protein [Paracoccaceae bacterium]
MLEYAYNGLLGLLTPQANTTAEAELSILLPPGMGLLTSRLISTKSSMNDRLIEYIDQIDKNCENFANAPIKALIFACTGASYFLEKNNEKIYFEKISKKRSYPIISATTAISDALAVLSVKRIGIVSPYADDLHEKAMSYWRANDFEIISIERLEQSRNQFHPIYSLESIFSETYFRNFDEAKVETVVILGTGLPTLRTLLKLGRRRILISANLCLMWRASLIVKNEAPSLNNLRKWISGEPWTDSFFQKTGYSKDLKKVNTTKI